jgi:hypothetical protein
VQLFLLGELDLARAVNLQMAVTGVAVDRDRGGAEYRGAQAFSSIQATRSPLQATSPHRICHEPLAARWFASLQAQIASRLMCVFESHVRSEGARTTSSMVAYDPPYWDLRASHGRVDTTLLMILRRGRPHPNGKHDQP